MTKKNQHSSPPTIADLEFDQIWIHWAEDGLSPSQAKRLALYQYTGGNAFGLINIFGEYVYAERPES